jgi:hypothetical protein
LATTDCRARQIHALRLGENLVDLKKAVSNETDASEIPQGDVQPKPHRFFGAVDPTLKARPAFPLKRLTMQPWKLKNNPKNR